MSDHPADPPAILYCHCQYAQVVPPEVRDRVLETLCASNLPFEAVPDLCELSARRDPSLKRLAAAGPLKIAACFPRAVKWLFAAAGAPLSPDKTEVLNMRDLPAERVSEALASPGLAPNLPAGQGAPAAASGSARPASTPVS